MHGYEVSASRIERRFPSAPSHSRGTKLWAVAPLLALILELSVAAQAPSAYLDDFEGPALDPFWITFATSGNVVMPATAVVHAGLQSIEMSTYNTSGVNKAAGVRHLFPTPTYGTVEVWMYDTGADVWSSNYLSLHTGPYTLGTTDYDLGPGNNGSTYQYSTLAGTVPTAIDRTQGWHRLTISTSPNAVVLSIDGIVVFTDVVGVPLPEVQLVMFAPSWRPPFNVYFDDFRFDPCFSGSCGQSNSACASLLANGIGANGNGPFQAQIGAILILQWAGMPHQPYVLGFAPSFNVGQNLGSGLIVDLDLSNYAIVLNGLDPAGFLFRLDSTGTSTIITSVPTALMGTVARVQGLVYDGGQVCGAGIGMMTTAAFELQL